MKNKANVTVHASTQDHLEILDIRNDIVLLKNGGACVVIRTTAVNFGLLSETEQDALIYSYAGFLNSLSFPIQIIVRSKKMDITSYLELLKQQEQTQINGQLKNQIQKYREFISSIIQENKVLDKGFFIIIPFSSLEMGVKKGTTSALFGGASKKPLFSPEYVLQKAKIALTPKRDNIIRLLSRMGLKAQPLATTELIKLFYEIYNPEEDIGQRVVSTSDYQTPLVQPVVDMPAPIQNMPVIRQPHQPPPPPVRQIGRAPMARPSVNQAVRGQRPQGKQLAPPPRMAQPSQINTAAQARGAQISSLQTRLNPAQAMPPKQAGPKPVSMDQVQSVLNRLRSEVTKMNQKR